MRRLLLPLLAALGGCNAASPYVTTIGRLPPGTTMMVRVADATVNAYAPAVSQPRELFTISATALPKGPLPPAPVLRAREGPAASGGILVSAPHPLASLLVRVPDRVDLLVESSAGDVNVTDIKGNVDVVAQRGNVTLMLPGYAQAAVGRGNLKVTMGATQWPGTLRFSAQRGDVEVWISAKAAFAVHLHTVNGTLFTDFGLRGYASGSSETIDGVVNGGGGAQRVDVEAATGAIRLLRMQPQP